MTLTTAATVIIGFVSLILGGPRAGLPPVPGPHDRRCIECVHQHATVVAVGSAQRQAKWRALSILTRWRFVLSLPRSFLFLVSTTGKTTLTSCLMEECKGPIASSEARFAARPRVCAQLVCHDGQVSGAIRMNDATDPSMICRRAYAPSIWQPISAGVPYRASRSLGFSGAWASRSSQSQRSVICSFTFITRQRRSIWWSQAR